VTRFLVTGAGGLLGSALVDALAGRPVVALGRRELDVTSAVDLPATLAYAGADVVLNAAGYTDVDGAEADVATAESVNAVAPGLLTAACAQVGAVLVHVSTDYVFAGDQGRPYDTDDPVGPLGVYGRTKEAGERAVRAASGAHYVVRTSWLYGRPDRPGRAGSGFVRTMSRLARGSDLVSVVDDQRGCPTYVADLADGLVELAESGAPYGTYHCTGAGDTTWFGLAGAVFSELGADPDRVRPVSTAEYPRPAPRPAYSVLSDRSWRSAGLTPLRPWPEALRDALAGPH
jgi:dTDP-4-dehydrorhamnose reductase